MSEPKKLTHLDESGAAHMVDVGDKDVTRRQATAGAIVVLGERAFEILTQGETPKGDAIATARIAGIQAVKRTSDLIPLCHPLPVTKVGIEFEFNEGSHAVSIECTVRCDGKTGVEMEALTGASIAALTIYDMLKAIEKGITIGPIRLLKKSGGKSGDWTHTTSNEEITQL